MEGREGEDLILIAIQIEVPEKLIASLPNYVHCSLLRLDLEMP